VGHTFASHLIAAGVDVVEVAAMLGHANATITLTVYAHAVNRRKSGSTALAKLAAFRRGGGQMVVARDASAGDHTEVVERSVS
jgi:hypothetical protein